MKKVTGSKKNPKLKKDPKKADSGELRKPSKLKPLKEKDKKNWKNSFGDDDEFEELPGDDSMKLEDLSNLEEGEEEEDFYNEDNSF